MKTVKKDSESRGRFFCSRYNFCSRYEYLQPLAADTKMVLQPVAAEIIQVSAANGCRTIFLSAATVLWVGIFFNLGILRAMV